MDVRNGYLDPENLVLDTKIMVLSSIVTEIICIYGNGGHLGGHLGFDHFPHGVALGTFSMLFWGLNGNALLQKKFCYNLFRVDPSESTRLLDYIGHHLGGHLE